MDIKGKNALLTGASNGIGKACAMMLAENGISKPDGDGRQCGW